MFIVINGDHHWACSCNATSFSISTEPVRHSVNRWFCKFQVNRGTSTWEDSIVLTTFSYSEMEPCFWLLKILTSEKWHNVLLCQKIKVLLIENTSNWFVIPPHSLWTAIEVASLCPCPEKNIPAGKLWVGSKSSRAADSLFFIPVFHSLIFIDQDKSLFLSLTLFKCFGDGLCHPHKCHKMSSILDKWTANRSCGPPVNYNGSPISPQLIRHFTCAILWHFWGWRRSSETCQEHKKKKSVFRQMKNQTKVNELLMSHLKAKNNIMQKRFAVMSKENKAKLLENL